MNAPKQLFIQDTEVSIQHIADWITNAVNLVNNGHPSQYLSLSVERETEDEWLRGYAKIRVSNHSGKRTNNGDSEHTISFITARCDQGYLGIDNEWEIEDQETLLTTTHEYVSDILEWELFENVKLSD